LVFRISGTMCDQNPVFWILKHTIALLCFAMFPCSCYARNLSRFFLLVLGFLCFADLDVLEELRYFYVMCCEYGDSDNCRC
jgi:hypothetical protein